MSHTWKQVLTNEDAQKLSDSVCWSDSSMVTSVICYTSIMLDDVRGMSGRALRFIMDCCSAPTSHLEVVAFGPEGDLKLPLDVDIVDIKTRESGKYTVELGFGSELIACSVYYRFINIDSRDAGYLLSQPSILTPAYSVLEEDGYSELTTPNGTTFLLTGRSKDSTLTISKADGSSVDIELDDSSRIALTNFLHRS